jgi:hypothetical protein
MVSTSSSEIMTVLIEVPAIVMHMASQFTSHDECKEGITCVHLQQTNNGLRVASTNGHFAFRCVVPYGPLCSVTDNEAVDNNEMLLSAFAFKKKVAYAHKVIMGNGEAKFIGGRKDTMDMLETRPCKASEWSFPSHFDSLWPDPASMDNAPAAPVTVNADYMRIICDVAAKFSDNGLIKMHFADSAHSAMLLTTSMDDLRLEMLLLPVMVRA